MILGVMAPFELVFHVLVGKHWMCQILLAEQGALPGAYLIGGSAWLAKTYASQQSILPGYSTIDTEEGQKQDTLGQRNGMLDERSYVLRNFHLRQRQSCHASFLTDMAN